MIFTQCSKWLKNYHKLIIPYYFQTAKLSVPCKSATMKKNLNDCIVWLDMEMTGLDVNTCQIIEVACLITDKNLEPISKDLNVVIHQPDEILSNMNEWCLKIHQKTGLINESRLSKVTINDAEQTILKYLKTYVEEGTCPLAGNSVYMDRMFLCKYMPLVNNYLHYRTIDVSTIKELIKRWNKNGHNFSKKRCHRALLDIQESIAELQYYKKNIFDILLTED